MGARVLVPGRLRAHRHHQVEGGPVPGQRSERVVTAAATSPTDVWAFSGLANQGSRVFRLVKSKWAVVKTFRLPIASATVLSSKDVWVFGTADDSGTARLGVYHYNGHTWTRVSPHPG